MARLLRFTTFAFLGAVACTALADPPQLTEQSAKRVEVVEKALNDPSSELRKLHKIAVDTFISKADFGRSRIPLPEELYKHVPKDWSLEDLEKQPNVDAKEIERLHLISMMTFATPALAGKKTTADKGHVVANLKLPSNWRLHSLGLVGLLLHKQPVVYTTTNEVRMQDLARTKKRAIDFLEEAGLDDLRRGEDFYVREKDGELRMLGAIRATQQCMKCHDVERGHLLGAFSYTMTKAPTPNPIKGQVPPGR
jgi:hypothetical protein